MKLHLTKIYRQWMRDGLAQEALGRQKKDFIALHFEQEREPTFQPQAWASAACLCLLLIFLLGSLRPAALIHTVDTLPVAMRPNVEVRRLTSSVGATMIYQQSYQNQPITIVWVFAT